MPPFKAGEAMQRKKPPSSGGAAIRRTQVVSIGSWQLRTIAEHPCKDLVEGK